jgi:hypothetical protein
MKKGKQMRSIIAAMIACTVLAGCGHSSKVQTRSAGAANQAALAGTVVIPAGTEFYGKLQEPIGSKVSKDGQAFQLQQTDTLMHKNAVLHGTVVEGHLENVHPAGPLHKPAMTIVFDDIVLSDGTKEPVNVQLLSANEFEAKTHHLRTIGMMIGGAVAGHEMKKHTGHGGALAGAAGGYVVSQGLKTDVYVPAGTVVALRFKSPVTR